MIKMVLCDCNTDNLLWLESNLKEYKNYYESGNLILNKFGSGIDLYNYISAVKGDIDIIFMTIDLSDCEGLMLAKSLTVEYPEIKIVIYGRTAEEIETMFYIGVSYFLYSPINKDSFILCLSKLSEVIDNKRKGYVNFNTKKGLITVNTNNINYLMSDKRKMIICEENNISIEVYYKLDEILPELGGGFLRCHQSFIVNMNKIKKFTQEQLLLNDGTLVPISQKKYYQAKKDYIEYIKQQY